MPAATTPQTNNFAPTLPVELVDEILQIAKPSKQQLARICLISKQFLWPARKLLYDTLELFFVPYIGCLVDTCTKTFRILRTLEINVGIRQLPSTVSFNYLDSQYHRYDTSGPEQREDTVIKTTLSLTPKVNRIILDHHFSDPASIISSQVAVVKTVTSLTIACLSLNEFELFLQLRTIRKLRITDKIVGKSWSRLPSLPHLEVLDLPYRHSLDPTSISRRLTALRFDLDSDTIDFSLLPHLKCLWLGLPYDREKVLSKPKFDKFVHLQDLFLDRDGAAEETLPCSLLDYLVANPPPQRICLIFPRVVPSTALIQYLDSSAPFVASEIRIALHNYVKPASLKNLDACCKSKDVKLSFNAPSGLGVFRLSCFLPLHTIEAEKTCPMQHVASMPEILPLPRFFIPSLQYSIPSPV
ncbi:hypothetical protein JCM5353_001553 [Sporobolomyces roseus]